MTRYAKAERHALCDTMLRLGPEAPTLCPPWRTRDLAAHLVIRERRPDLAAGMFLPALSQRLDKAMAQRAQGDWERLVEDVRSGPPLWSAMRPAPVDEAVNTLEFFVHHEDVLRAQPDWQPRSLPAEQERSLWEHLTWMAGLMYRRAPVGVILVADRVGRAQVHRGTSQGTVAVRATAADLVLFSYGRQQVATVKFSGPDTAIAALRATRLSVP